MEGFYEGENDGPYRIEEVIDNREADVEWKFDMMAQLGTLQHNMCTCLRVPAIFGSW